MDTFLYNIKEVLDKFIQKKYHISGYVKINSINDRKVITVFDKIPQCIIISFLTLNFSNIVIEKIEEQNEYYCYHIYFVGY